MKSRIAIRRSGSSFFFSTMAAIALLTQQSRGDDFESGITLWQPTGNWGTTTNRYVSPTHAVTDTPGAYYTNGSDSALTLASGVDLSAMEDPVLAFHHSYELESGYDFGHVEISNDGGVTWQTSPPLASYSGVRAAMTREQLDLAAFDTSTNFKIRFRMVTDSSVVMDGWYLDDVVIGSAPVPVTLQTPAGSDVSQTSVVLNWSASSDPAFASYVVLRGTAAGFDWRTAKTVAVITEASTTQCMDIACAPKSTYRYKVMKLNSAGLHALSNEVAATTPAGMDYPFLDDGEAGPNVWIATPPWALSDEGFNSAGHAWSDSPGGNYANNTSSQPLVLAAPMDLSTATAPVLTFYHQYALASGDTANVEISTNLGSSWSQLASYPAGTIDWKQVRIPLTSYVGQSSVLLRFRLTTNASDNADGWRIDDISVAEAPAAVSAPSIGDVTSHGLRLTWNANNSLPFSHYAIHRSTSPGVGIHSPRIAVISDQAQTTFTETGLALDTLYFYRVYAVSPYGTYSTDSLNESSALTLNNPLPFAEDFDSDLLSWNTGADVGTSAWGLSSTVKHSGASALASSPNASYAQSTNTWIETSIDLRNTEWPVLTFWDRYGLNTGDWIRLDISASGGPTLYPYGSYQGARSEWRMQRVDLSPWKGLGNVKLRFRIISDGGATSGEGWFIDDLAVAENPNRNNPLTLPFTDDFESGAANWLLCGWNPETEAAAVNGTGVLRYGSSTSQIGPEAQHWAMLDRPIILPQGSNVQATFWLRGLLNAHSYQRLQYSTNGGIGWGEFTEVNRDTGFNSNNAWQRCQASLASLSVSAPQTMRLRFACGSSYGSVPTTDISLDKLTLAQMPAAVALTSAVPALRSVNLTWDGTSLGATFQRYEVWRSSNANVSITNGQKVFESTDPAALGLTEGGLNIGGTYYYKVFTIDDRDTYIPSNEMSATTVPVDLPFADTLDNMDNWVTGSNNSNPSTWSVNTTNPHQGSASLATVPVGQYTPSTDSYIETAVDLRDTEWPVLTFWDRYGLNTADWIRLEISAIGGPTLYPYGFYQGARSEWRMQRVDLSPWKGLSNVKLRFRITSDGGATSGEGWFIDDLAVAENPNRNNPLTLPITDDFESGADNWLLSGWNPESDTAAVNGTGVLRYGSSTNQIGPEAQHWAMLDRPIILPQGSNVQATFWLRGLLNSHSYQRLQYSTNGGIGWGEFTEVNRDTGFNSNNTWQRCQASLAFLPVSAPQTMRLRFACGSSYGSVPATDISLDKLTLAQMPAAVALTSAVPALRSVDLTWDGTSLGTAFQRYEVWRSSNANVSITNGQKVFESTNPATLNFTDSGLNIGGTYYYKVFTIDERDTYIPSNEMSATTVPVDLPFADAMDDMDNWVTGSNNATPTTWSANTNNPHQGSASLATMAVGQYPASTDSYIETAVDLRDTEWPVLTFWDRYGLNTADWIRLEISATGGPTLYPYGFYQGARSEWRMQRVDLSPWKGLGNVKLRFRITSDGGATSGEGWFIDDLAVAENPNRNNPLTLPITDDFESGAANWLLSGWNPESDAAAVNGTGVLRYGSSTNQIGPEAQHWAMLDRPIILPQGSNVQATFWLRGLLNPHSYQRLQYSTNGGIGWGEFTEVNRDTGFNSNNTWQRCQASLASLSVSAPQTMRLRFTCGSSYGSVPATDISLDKLTLAQMPAAVAMLPIDEVGVTSMRVNWSPSTLDTFQRYEIYRSTTSTVNTTSTLVASLTDRNTSSFTNSGLEARIQYYYRVYMVDTRDTYSPSEITSAITRGMAVPLADDFGTQLPGWIFTGQWQLQPGVGRDGSAALVDSPGDSLAYTDTHARFAVNLNGTQWPVLRYWDRHDFAGSSWGRVEVSSDNNSWTIVNGVTETRNTWQMQEVDLSQWKNQVRVFIRFRSGTDGNLADGWVIDDLALTDRAVESVYPFFDGFESGSEHWLAGSWNTVSSNPYLGIACMQDTANRRYGPDTPNILTLAREIDLTHAVDPQLTFFLRGSLTSHSYFRVQVSTDGGLNWPELSALNRDSGFNSVLWLKQQLLRASLVSYIGKKIRLRIVTSSIYGSQPACDIFLDNIGIGEATPGAPILVSPSEGETVTALRPTLTVANAIDYQSDSLTHQFEVYADAALTQLVCQVPAVASGVTTTSWEVDVDLTDNAPYWWRARASDGANTGPWSEAVVFNINEFNNPPLPVTVASPANDSLLIDGNGLLVWYQTLDPDLGDEIRDYQIQIDNDYLFGSPEINISGITVGSSTFGPGFLASVSLADLPGSANLATGRWFWRIRGRDTRYAIGAWSEGYSYFRLPTFYQRYLRAVYPDPDWFLDNVTNPAADPDGNGVGVLMEFACAIPPGENPGGRLPRSIELQIDVHKHLGFEWTRRKLSELDFILETSTNLVDWSTDTRASVEVLHSVDEISERVRIVDPDPVGRYRTRFIRMHVKE